MNPSMWNSFPAFTTCHPTPNELGGSNMFLRKHRPPHAGFSLLEVILATAILAASSMVLLSLLGLGTKYGNRAEERSLVASQAQSLLDEFLVSSSSNATAGDSRAEEEQERTGVLPGLPSHAYRLTTERFEPSGQDLATAGSSASSSNNSRPTARLGLTLVTIQVFDSVEQNTDDAPLLLELSQLVRNSLLAPPADSTSSPVRDPFQLTD